MKSTKIPVMHILQSHCKNLAAEVAENLTKQPSIEVGLAALALTFHPLQTMVMTYSHAKVQCQWSVNSEDRVETNGWTEVIALPL